MLPNSPFIKYIITLYAEGTCHLAKVPPLTYILWLQNHVVVTK